MALPTIPGAAHDLRAARRAASLEPSGARGSRIRGSRTWRPTLRHAVTAVLSLAGLVCLSVVFYSASVHATPATSDGATVLLEGQAMAQGHVLLHGWYLSLDSFWSVDALFYMVGYLMSGLAASLMAWVPAVIAALVVAVGALIAAHGRRGVAGVAGGAAVVGLLAFPSHAMATFFLRGPLHIGTALWTLVAFWALRRARLGWGVVAAAVVLAAGMLGDLQILAYGVIPVLAVGLLTMARTGSRRAGMPLVWAATGAITLAVVARLALDVVGGFNINRVHAISNVHQAWENVLRLFSYLGALTGSPDAAFGSGGVPMPLELAHLIGGLLVAAIFLAALARVVKIVAGARHRPMVDSPVLPIDVHAGDESTVAAEWVLDDLLAMAAVGAILSFGALAVTNSTTFARYLVPAVVFAAVLTGRAVGRWWERAGSWRPKGIAAAIAAVVMCSYAASLGYALAVPAPEGTAATLAAYLEAHHLTEGVGDYWSSNITTVDSGGKVVVRPVVTESNGQLVRYVHQSSRGWYEGQSFQFFVWDRAQPWDDVDTASASLTWGPPASVTDVGPYQVVMWSAPIQLSPPGS